MIAIITGQQNSSGGGNTVLFGQGPPSSGIGKDGDSYIDKANPSIYGPKANGAWPDPLSLGGTSFITRSGSTAPYIAQQPGQQQIVFPVDNPISIELFINGLLQPENLFTMNGNVATVLASADVHTNDAIEFIFETVSAGVGGGGGGGGDGGIAVDEKPSGVIDGVNKSFSLSKTPIPYTLNVFVNGMRQDSDDFTITNATLTFNLPPSATSKLRATYSWQ